MAYDPSMSAEDRRKRLIGTVQVHRSHEAARQADAEQQAAMTVEERQAAARELKRRAWPGPNPDVREYERAP